MMNFLKAFIMLYSHKLLKSYNKDQKYVFMIPANKSTLINRYSGAIWYSGEKIIIFIND